MHTACGMLGPLALCTAALVASCCHAAAADSAKVEPPSSSNAEDGSGYEEVSLTGLRKPERLEQASADEARAYVQQAEAALSHFNDDDLLWVVKVEGWATTVSTNMALRPRSILRIPS